MTHTKSYLPAFLCEKYSRKIAEFVIYYLCSRTGIGFLKAIRPVKSNEKINRARCRAFLIWFAIFYKVFYNQGKAGPASDGEEDVCRKKM